MNAERILIALTALNLALLVSPSLWHAGSATANSATPVIRGRALEIVDDRGRVRASITIQPAHTFEPTGAKYPETVILRLIDANGRPEVKIVASEQGGGLSFVGDSDTTQALLAAEGDDSRLKLTNRDGRQQLIKP